MTKMKLRALIINERCEMIYAAYYWSGLNLSSNHIFRFTSARIKLSYCDP